MAFLEPWTLGTPVCGRNLAETTGQFAADGLQLPGCYDRLEVPQDWLGAGEVERAAEDGLTRNLAAYGRQPQPGDVQRVVAAWVRDGRVDFGRLHEAMQEQVLERDPDYIVTLGMAAADAYRELRRVQHRARLDEVPTEVTPPALQAEQHAVLDLWHAVFGENSAVSAKA